MTVRFWISLFLLGVPCGAWDTTPHQQITRAALHSIPKQVLCRFGDETQPLVEIYCLYPDHYVEMERFGFVRKGPGPRTVGEIRRYCLRPDGQPIHGITGDREFDTGSVVYLLERIVTSLSAEAPGEAARYAGVLSHFIADSFSPPHAVTDAQLHAMAQPSAVAVNLHAVIERSIPDFTLAARRPQAGGRHLVDVATAILDECYGGAKGNRRDLPSMVQAAAARDEGTLDSYRLRAGTKAAETLADALYTVLRME